MHIPQIWSLRYSDAYRWTVCPSVECRQRENLRVPLVLVHLAGGGNWFGIGVPLSCPIGSSTPDVPTTCPGPIGTSR